MILSQVPVKALSQDVESRPCQRPVSVSSQGLESVKALSQGPVSLSVCQSSQGLESVKVLSQDVESRACQGPVKVLRACQSVSQGPVRTLKNMRTKRASQSETQNVSKWDKIAYRGAFAPIPVSDFAFNLGPVKGLKIDIIVLRQKNSDPNWCASIQFGDKLGACIIVPIDNLSNLLSILILIIRLNVGTRLHYALSMPLSQNETFNLRRM